MIRGHLRTIEPSSSDGVRLEGSFSSCSLAIVYPPLLYQSKGIYHMPKFLVTPVHSPANDLHF